VRLVEVRYLMSGGDGSLTRVPTLTAYGRSYPAG
jgi:hypothetical protein